MAHVHCLAHSAGGYVVMLSSSDTGAGRGGGLMFVCDERKEELGSQPAVTIHHPKHIQIREQ